MHDGCIANKVQAQRSKYVSRPPLSLREWVDLPFRLLVWAPVQLTINLVRGVLTAIWRRLPLRPYIACAAIRMYLYTFSPAQIQLFSPPTMDTYKAWIRKKRSKARRSGDTELMEQLKEDIEVLPDGRPHILWIGDRRKATKIVYFFHGGGYITPAIPGHMEWCLQAYVVANKHMRNSRDRVAVAVLQYTLTPQARFPTQMCQAASGLAHLLRSGVRPSQLVVGGDSAGGNLTVQLLSHLLHPYPLAEKIDLAEPLAGAFLVSPLVSQNMLTRSFVDGRPCDMLSEGIFDNPNREMFHEKPSGLAGVLFPNWNLVETKEFREGRGWALMADVDEKWLDGMANIVRKVYVTCGKHELLRDQGIDIAERIRARNPDVEVKLEVAEKEAHDFILLEGQRQVVGDATTRMRNWFCKVWS
ncbi:hypothetical protein J7T55_002478 [Diaporthe amygdali]|uniref:uncharacterized protein n=1 Tax=Phomopsis amygdali TaxID=1214568 RepID=UPI0022FEE5E3|nr:uncharacterized protein J7T55_002478 [Diaporthe amygdali]KAJ0121967.1 hypothetical protein J7T55_002478 [Diaporthe amygdali]